MKYLFLFTLLFTAVLGQNVGIGVATPDPSSKLEVYSTNSGVLLPRLTTAQRNAITSPAVGLLIYNTDVNCYEFWSGSAWISLCKTCTSPPPAPNILGATDICFGNDYTYTGSGAPSGATYVWQRPNGSNYTGNPLTVVSATNSDTGWYYLQYYYNGCYSLRDSIHVIKNTSTWARKTDFPGIPRDKWYTPYFVIGTKLYVVGGYSSISTHYNDCWSYDFTTDTWTSCANFPTTHISHATGLSYGNGKGYIVGGRFSPSGTYVSNAYQYNPSTNTWSSIANFPRTLGSTFRSSTQMTGLGLPCGSNGNIYDYDDISNVWVSSTIYPAGGTPTDGSFRFIFEDGTYVYIGGGHSNCPCCTPKYTEMRRYVKTTGGGWQLLSTIPASAAPIIPNPVVIPFLRYIDRF